MKRIFNNATCVVETRHSGVQPAIFITDNTDTVWMITNTPSGDLTITNEGKVGKRYNRLGDWIGNDPDNSKKIEVGNESYFYVIEAERDGCRKYVSRSFPRPYMYSIKLSRARRFDSIESAEEFITSFNRPGKHMICDAVIRKVKRSFNVEYVSNQL